MNQLISEEKTKEFMKIEGEVRGTTLKAYGEYIFKEEGESGLKKLEDAIAGLGYPIKYQEMQAMEFFPIGYQAITIEVIKSLFNYSPDKFQEFGRFSAKFSLIIRLFMKYFVSPKEFMRRAPTIWKKSYTVGNLEIVEFDQEKKRAVARVKTFKLHPLQCHILKGFFSSVLGMMLAAKLTADETKCVYQGDEYHEFLLKW